MTAIVLLVRELCDLSDAFWRNQFNLSRSLLYYHTKRRLKLFCFHCRNHWLRQDILNSQSSDQIENMQNAGRADIDFAAVDASKIYYHTENLDFQHMDIAKDIEIIDGKEFKPSFYEYSDEEPKYRTDQIGELKEGVSFTFTGKIAINCERFSINFIYQNDSGDIALHINPRLPQNYIVRNTKVSNIWGREDVSSALPFLLRRGGRFAIQVLVTNSCYMISMNGHHFSEYPHRLPFKDVKILEVKGDVEDVNMECTQVESYPNRLTESKARIIEMDIDSEINEVDAKDEETPCIPHEWCLITTSKKMSMNYSRINLSADPVDTEITLPYYGTMSPKSLKNGRCIKIEGRVRLLPHSFYINLQQGQNIWPHPFIAFHFNPRFSQTSTGAIGKAVVCRNAWHDGSWSEEERSELDTNFRPGKTFSLAIVCTENFFEVYVNRKFITQFKYRIKPEVVDTVYIQGDVKLWKVRLDQNPIIKGKQIRIYHNPSSTDEF